jgi:hypothetical protein
MTNSVKLAYSVEYNTDPRYPLSTQKGTCLGVLFNTEQEAWSYLDLVALQGTILEASISDVPTPRKREVYATTRSWE